jgi:hypothetical protein
MPDVIFVGLIVLFFAAVVLLVKGWNGPTAANGMALVVAMALVERSVRVQRRGRRVRIPVRYGEGAGRRARTHCRRLRPGHPPDRTNLDLRALRAAWVDVSGGLMRHLGLTEPASLEVLDRLDDLGGGVHDERAVTSYWLPDR